MIRQSHGSRYGHINGMLLLLTITRQLRKPLLQSATHSCKRFQKGFSNKKRMLKDTSQAKSVPSTPAPSNAATKTPISILKRRRSEGGRHVSLGAVEVREYERQFGGSVGVPTVGASPLGLGNKVVRQKVYESVADHEAASSPCHNTELAPVPAKKRRKLLHVDRATQQAEVAALENLRMSRQEVGCACVSLKACSSRKCLCVREGISCHAEACLCARESCANTRYELDEDKVDEVRQATLHRAPTHLSFSPSSQTGSPSSSINA
eukprot:Colp12_sorted_trinity150504_noHs@36087